MNRDNFTLKTKEVLAKRVAYHCARPECRILLIGPHTDPNKALLLGNAAHITAAAAGGPRFDETITPDQRAALENGVWLCPTDATLVDKDKEKFPVALLKQWQVETEQWIGNLAGKQIPAMTTVPNLISTFSPRVWQADRIDRFHFSARATAMIGRDTEFTALQCFCDAMPERKFQWWLMTGKGGMGKSRLAFELGETLAMRSPAWDWQFLDNELRLKKNLATLSDGKWQPRRNTLLIVDYAAFVVDELRNAIIVCAGATQHWHHSVRLLVIERTLDDDWYTKLFNSTSGNDKFMLADSRYRAEPLTLPALALPEGRAILQEMLARYPAKSVPDLDNLLVKLDVEHRPLFILFLADALHEGVEQITWDSAALISQVLNREMACWDMRGMLEADKELLCFATLAGKIDLAATLPPYVESLLTKAETVKVPSLKQRMAIALHEANDGKFIPKLEPDLLGELFVLETVALAENVRDVKQAIDQPLIEALWLPEFQLGAYAFINKAAQDFPQHPRLELLLNRLASVCPNNIVQQALFTSYYYTQFIGYSQKSNSAAMEEFFEKITQLPIQESNSFNIRTQSHTAAHFVGYYCRAGQLPQACEKFKFLTELGLRFTGEQYIALQQAGSAADLINAYCNVGQYDEALAMMAFISKITLLFPDDPDVSLAQVHAALFLCNIDWENDEDEENIYDTLIRSHIKKYPDHDETIELIEQIMDDDFLRTRFDCDN
jgi:hypothetical protein